MNKKIFLLLIFFALIGISKFHAQGPPPPPPPTIPIDGGISFLIAAGVAYGSKKVIDSRKKDS